MVSFSKFAVGALICASGVSAGLFDDGMPLLLLRVTRYYSSDCAEGTNLDLLDSMGPQIKQDNCHHFPDESFFNSITWRLFSSNQATLAEYGYCGIKIYGGPGCKGFPISVVPNVNDYRDEGKCGNYNVTKAEPFKEGVGVRLVCEPAPWGRNEEWL